MASGPLRPKRQAADGQAPTGVASTLTFAPAAAARLPPVLAVATFVRLAALPLPMLATTRRLTVRPLASVPMFQQRAR